MHYLRCLEFGNKKNRLSLYFHVAHIIMQWAVYKQTTTQYKISFIKENDVG